MHAERVTVGEEAAARMNLARAAGGRLVAVGTTALRSMESAADEEGRVHPLDGETEIFITPGYRFRAADMLVTNFHLPCSTLFMLVCAFSGMDVMKRAYAEAITQGLPLLLLWRCLSFDAGSGRANGVRHALI